MEVCLVQIIHDSVLHVLPRRGVAFLSSLCIAVPLEGTGTHLHLPGNDRPSLLQERLLQTKLLLGILPNCNSWPSFNGVTKWVIPPERKCKVTIRVSIGEGRGNLRLPAVTYGVTQRLGPLQTELAAKVTAGAASVRDSKCSGWVND